MASIIRRGDTWRAYIYRAGHRESKTFDSKQQAIDWATEREAAIIAGEVTGSAHTLAAAMDRYERSAVPMMRSQRSELARLAILRRVDFVNKPLRQITAEHVSTWRDARLGQVKPGTVIREMTTLRAVFEHARKDLGWLAVNPVRDVKRPPEPPARKRLISDAERDALLKAFEYTGTVETVQHEAAVALLIALETGMRAGEILGLEWSRVHLDDRFVVLTATKNGDRREVPLSLRAVELLKSMQGRRLRHVRSNRAGDRVFHIDVDTLGVLFRRAREVAKVEGVTFHDSRATAITRLATRLQPLELARMIGHRDLSELLTYFRSPASDIAKRLD